MKIGEAIKALQKFDPEKDLLLWGYDHNNNLTLMDTQQILLDDPESRAILTHIAASEPQQVKTDEELLENVVVPIKERHSAYETRIEIMPQNPEIGMEWGRRLNKKPYIYFQFVTASGYDVMTLNLQKAANFVAFLRKSHVGFSGVPIRSRSLVRPYMLTTEEAKQAADGLEAMIEPQRRAWAAYVLAYQKTA
jgi:hypothetical protein